MPNLICCPACGVLLNASDALGASVEDCPKCGAPLQRAAPQATAIAPTNVECSAEQPAAGDAEEFDYEIPADAFDINPPRKAPRDATGNRRLNWRAFTRYIAALMPEFATIQTLKRRLLQCAGLLGAAAGLFFLVLLILSVYSNRDSHSISPRRKGNADRSIAATTSVKQEAKSDGHDVATKIEPRADEPRSTPAAPDVPADAEVPKSAVSVQSSMETWTIPAHEGTIWSVAFSPDGNSLVTASDDRTVRLWDVETKRLKHTYLGHWNLVRSAIFSRDGQRLITGSIDRTVRVWNPETGEVVRTFGDVDSIFFIALLPDQKTLVTSSRGSSPGVWDLEQGKLIRRLTGHTATTWAVASAGEPPNATLVSGSTDQTVKLWDAESGNVLRSLTGHRSDITSVAISADAATIASGAMNGEVLLWDTASGTLRWTIPATASIVYEVAISPDGATIAAARNDHTVTLYAAATGTQLRKLSGGGWCVGFSPDGRLLASGSDDRLLRVWDITGMIPAALPGQP